MTLPVRLRNQNSNLSEIDFPINKWKHQYLPSEVFVFMILINNIINVKVHLERLANSGNGGRGSMFLGPSLPFL